MPIPVIPVVEEGQTIELVCVADTALIGVGGIDKYLESGQISDLDFEDSETTLDDCTLFEFKAPKGSAMNLVSMAVISNKARERQMVEFYDKHIKGISGLQLSEGKDSFNRQEAINRIDSAIKIQLAQLLYNAGHVQPVGFTKR